MKIPITFLTILQACQAYLLTTCDPNKASLCRSFSPPYVNPSDDIEGLPSTATSPPKVQPEILTPFLPAADPEYLNRGPVGENEFIVSRVGGPTEQELSNENILKIVRSECTDLEVNTLVWKCLGYRFQGNESMWTSVECFPKWREKYPTPPDFIGMQRIYSKEIDMPSLRSNQALVRSIPDYAKQQLRKHLKPLGFSGYKVAELTPNKTRRAQCANWLLYYREELFGFSIDELLERKRRREQDEQQRRTTVDKASSQEDGWKPPVREVF